MRTLNPVSIRADFHAALRDIDSAYIDAEDANVVNTTRKRFAEYSLLASAVLWEGYVSDLFIAYINRDHSRFESHVVRQTTLSEGDGYSRRARDNGHLILSLGSHLTAEQIRRILDPHGRNLTFDTLDGMKADAGKLLAPPHARPFLAMGAVEGSLLDAVRRLRNFRRF